VHSLRTDREGAGSTCVRHAARIPTTSYPRFLATFGSSGRGSKSSAPPQIGLEARGPPDQRAR
jgi:hypothetical protein